MSDFFQHGLISTLHRLNEAALPAEETLNGTKVGLLLPCHAREIGTEALARTIETLNQIRIFDHVIVSTNGTHAPDQFVEFWSSLRLPHSILWNDSPVFGSWLKARELTALPGNAI